MDIKVFEYFISQIFAAAIKTARTKEEWRGEGGEVSELGGKNISWPHTLARLMARLACTSRHEAKGCCLRAGAGMKTERAGRLLVMPASSVRAKLINDRREEVGNVE